jgi:hypothetical protein
MNPLELRRLSGIKALKWEREAKPMTIVTVQSSFSIRECRRG